MHLRTSIRLPYPLKVFCLTGDGVLVPTFLGSELLLLDRNLVSKARQADALKDPAQRYWINEFNRAANNLNPILTAYEGCHRRRPTKAEFQAELRDSYIKLKEAFPHKNVIEHSPETCDTLYEAVSARLDRFEEEVGFLVEVAPLAAHRATDRDLMPRIARVAEVARAHGLHGQSLAPIAVISALAESKRGEKPSAGRQVVKPSTNYSAGDAHNAVADLHSLEWLTASTSGPFGPIALATMDAGVARFWHSMQLKRAVRDTNNHVHYRFRLDKALCPRLTESQLESVREMMQ